ncbi:glycosyltransferase family 2 protein [Thioalkalivibrio sp. ALMg13-2]|uniref:glycosyltransferase family 2 protein n=1 Tax=Thioalkalivibrio sp. ALMg13-2 TaxID=1158167 RepID=UPI00037F63AB|nr:glycosyltransferase family 2 protein [Thioalkalivibrio sp. ALMg13-2]
MITVSIVSHGHGEMVSWLARRLLALPEVTQILVTLNRWEELDFPQHSKLEVIQNQRRFGFGYNHNRAFQRATEPYFCVMNPDVILTENPFPSLLGTLSETGAGLVAPQVYDAAHTLQPSARRFPTVASLARKLLKGETGAYPSPARSALTYPDWVAGLFMLASRDAYRDVNGFDRAYFLYYEDVDLCARLWAAGHTVVLDPNATIIHDAQKRSHADPIHFLMHVRSLLRYLRKHRFRLSRRSTRSPNAP